MICDQCKGEGTLEISVPNPYNFGPPTPVVVPCGACGAYYEKMVNKLSDHLTDPDTDHNAAIRAYIMKAWRFLRKNNQDIPDEVLDFMRDAALEALEK
jgi:hypothetical protein